MPLVTHRVNILSSLVFLLEPRKIGRARSNDLIAVGPTELERSGENRVCPGSWRGAEDD